MGVLGFMMRIYSHRGFCDDRLFPENSIPAFEAAIRHGADGFEFDVQLSKDETAVCYHDPTLNRVGIPKAVRELNCKELTQIDLGGGSTIPTLVEILEKFGNRTFLNIEVKSPEVAPEVAKLIQKSSLTLSPNNVIVSSFLEQTLAQIRQINPEIPTGMLYTYPRGKIKLARRLSCVSLHPFFGKIPYLGIDVIYRFLIRRNIRNGQKLGFRINRWTVNTSKLIRELLRLSVSGIITDNLDEAIKLRNEYYSE